MFNSICFSTKEIPHRMQVNLCDRLVSHCMWHLHCAMNDIAKWLCLWIVFIIFGVFWQNYLIVHACFQWFVTLCMCFLAFVFYWKSDIKAWLTGFNLLIGVFSESIIGSGCACLAASYASISIGDLMGFQRKKKERRKTLLRSCRLPLLFLWVLQ